MKKILTAIALLTIAGTGFAQSIFSVGYLNSTHKFSEENRSFNGIYAGAAYDFALGQTGLTLTPGLFYAYDIRRDNVSEYSQTVSFLKEGYNSQWKEHSLNVPVRISYGYEVSPMVRVFAFGGPVASLSLYSKKKISPTVEGFSAYDQMVDYLDGDYSFKKFDIKLGAGIGVDIAGNFRITAGYDFGLVNRYDTDGNSLHTNIFHIGIAYIYL